jgi:hypothetical protein
MESFGRRRALIGPPQGSTTKFDPAPIGKVNQRRAFDRKAKAWFLRSFSATITGKSGICWSRHMGKFHRAAAVSVCYQNRLDVQMA